ncbi:MAG: hypothetical protein K2X87_10935 [Gemmataceae bacterium]|nr:hypothetical protein [Gemmataceae bacterium]
MSGGPAARFRVLIPPAIADRLRDFVARESAVGRGPEARAALRELDYRLNFEADEWGESREYLPVMRFQMRFGTTGPISAWFGVNETNRLVRLKEVRFRGDPREE